MSMQSPTGSVAGSSVALARSDAREASLRVRYPTPDEWEVMEKMTKRFCASSMAKAMELQDEGMVMALAMQGLELGVSFMSSLRGIRMIHGRPTLSDELMKALAEDRISGARVEFSNMGDEGEAVCTAVRPGRVPVTIKHTVEDAKRAKLDGKETYQRYPAQLLRAWCIRDACRLQYTELYYGLSVAQAVSFETDDKGLEVIETEGELVAPDALAGLTEPVARTEPAGASATVVTPPAASTELPAERGQPEDKVLEFTQGTFKGKKLSELDEKQLRQLVKGFQLSLQKAVDESNVEREANYTKWVTLIRQWTDYRGVKLAPAQP